MFDKYPSPLIALDDISLLSLELEHGSERPGDEGPLLETKLGGPLQPTPMKDISKNKNDKVLIVTGNFISVKIYIDPK